MSLLGVLAGLGPRLITGGLTPAAVSSQQTFRQALRAKLLTIPELTAIVGTHIYSGVVPNAHDFDAQGPALVYGTRNASVERHMDRILTGSAGTQFERTQFTAASYIPADVDAISEVVFWALEGLINDDSWGDGSMVVMSCTRGEEYDHPIAEGQTKKWIFQIISEYEIKHRIAVPR